MKPLCIKFDDTSKIYMGATVDIISTDIMSNNEKTQVNVETHPMYIRTEHGKEGYHNFFFSRKNAHELMRQLFKIIAGADNGNPT
jgi:hypothetical protein